MPARLIVLDIIAVLAGAVVGLFVVDILAWLLFDTSVSGMVASVGRWIIVLVAVGLFAVYYRMLPPTGAAIASFFTGVVVPLVAEKIVFGSSLPTTSLLFLYVVFAVVALFTYRFVRAGKPVRGKAAQTGRSDP
ncbi:hypothetical protein [Aurantimonas sp. 22II-16-19i]|uniref:hypothetical protein n=1 Tax=Aurantimonas sp. 22II-16-19i TaxID=1317114 RepID=UPI0009F7A212|nr:hypothetical protein [Aurantimonas sp. 22II-16-19i]ORE92343.1 hypothetical protein ATO4_17517 [Aurantimonas sp. 22II-16-19i]